MGGGVEGGLVLGVLGVALVGAVAVALGVRAARSVARHRGGALSDREVLHGFGYAQELLRDMGGFSSFALSFSIISILTGAVTLYGVGLAAGGPPVMGFGWPLVTLFVLLVAASLAELASAVPTSGALYHWAALLGGPGWGWTTAGLNLVGLVATIAGIDYGCAQFLAPLLGLDATPGTLLALCAALVLSHAALNHVGIRVVARLNDLSAVYHVAAVVLLVAALVAFAPRQPVAFLFERTFSTLEGAPYLFAFATGLLQAQWTYTGYDASAHAVEETRDARVRAPWGIYLSVALSGVFGFVMLAAVTLSIDDLAAAAAAPNAFVHVLEHALGETAGRALLWVVTIAMWFCGLSCVTSTSRMVFAFSRDGGLPGSRLWARVSHRHRTPAAAIWLSATLALALPAAIQSLVAAAPGAFVFERLYPAVTGVSTIALYLSYGAPLLLKLRARRRGLWSADADGPWSLGAWSAPVNAIALGWIAIITVLFVLPPNTLTGVVMAVSITALVAYYALAERGRFRGPVPQAASREELLLREAELGER
jgi:amino acid transporter